MITDTVHYVAIAWTRPVNWAGFSTLPADIDAAATKSRTIRYQRDLIRLWVKQHGGVLVHEEAVMELSPDRATPQAAMVIATLRKTYPAAIFIAVDFPKADGWRPHVHLQDLLDQGPSTLIDPDPYYAADFSFDPTQHFSAWEKHHDAHRQAKPAHRAKVLAALAEDAGHSLAQKAEILNARGLTTHTGKAWTKDNLAKFLNTGPKDA